MTAANDVKQLLAQYTAEVRDLALQVRDFILQAVPGVEETVDSSAKVIGYGFGAGYKGMLCTIILSKSGVNENGYGAAHTRHTGVSGLSLRKPAACAIEN